jgi:TusA-related sulfurtransferase
MADQELPPHQNIGKHNSKVDTEFFLDITAEVCPLTFVRTKLLIERMAAGQVASIRLKGAEPLANVPRAVRDLGHEVLSLTAEVAEPPAADRWGVHLLRIRKR